MENPPDNRPKASMLRSITIGSAALAFCTAPGTCFYLYQWITTGNASLLGEALALFSVATIMGGSGGAAYHLVMQSRINSRWKPFLAILAAIQAYLLAFMPLVLLINLFAPKLNEGLPLANIWFYLGLNGYGLLLCVVAFGFAYAPRIVQLTIAGVCVVALLLASAVLLVPLFIAGPEDLERWFVLLRPLSIAFKLALLGLALVSLVGWVRFFRGSRDGKEAAPAP